MILIDCTKRLSATNIKYILAIRDLITNDMEPVRSIEVAKRLRVSKPSVHVMLNILREMCIITKKENGEIEFTTEGRKMADKYQAFYNAWNHYLDGVLLDNTNRKAAICAMIAELTEEDNRKISEVI